MISRAALLTSPRVRKLGVPPNLIIVLPSELASVDARVDAEAVSSGGRRDAAGLVDYRASQIGYSLRAEASRQTR
jgi:hypothetical protein